MRESGLARPGDLLQEKWFGEEFATMRVLVLGHGKTGKLVAEVAHERGHGVHVLDAKENREAMALTPPFVAGFDVVIDFTTPEAVLQNMRACLATGAHMVIGTTGWYSRLKDMEALAERKQAGLLYGTNFSVGVQVMMEMAGTMAASLKHAGYRFRIEETHHTSKLDAPSGTAITLADTVRAVIESGEVPITSKREGDAVGEHALLAESEADRLVLTHTSASRRAFAEGAVRAAEWLATRRGTFDFKDIYKQL